MIPNHQAGTGVRPRLSVWGRFVRLALAGVVLWALWRVQRAGVIAGWPFGPGQVLPPGTKTMLVVLVLGTIGALAIGVGWRPRI